MDVVEIWTAVLLLIDPDDARMLSAGKSQRFRGDVPNSVGGWRGGRGCRAGFGGLVMRRVVPVRIGGFLFAVRGRGGLTRPGGRMKLAVGVGPRPDGRSLGMGG